MSKPTLIESFTAGAAITKRRIVAHGTSDHYAIQAAASDDDMFGISDSLGAAGSGSRCDVITAGLAEVEYGGTVTRGDRLTADANGKAVAASASGISKALIAGGSAGDHTVTGIKTTDELIAVFEQDGTSGLLTDLTSEFSISAADTINNAAGTDTTSDKLLVLYKRPQRCIGIARVSGVSGDIGTCQIAPGAV